VELSTARRHNLGSAVKGALAGDLRGPHDAARDRHLDVVGASPDGQARATQPRGRSPPPLADRRNHGDQYFVAGAGPLCGRVSGRRAVRSAIAEAVSFTANTTHAGAFATFSSFA
jgi:hypothetical protein